MSEDKSFEYGSVYEETNRLCVGYFEQQDEITALRARVAELEGLYGNGSVRHEAHSQDKADRDLMELFASSRKVFQPAHVVRWACSVLARQYKSMEFLPAGHARRHIEDACSPNTAYVALQAMEAARKAEATLNTEDGYAFVGSPA